MLREGLRVNEMTDPEKQKQLDNEVKALGFSTRKEWYRKHYLYSEHWKALREAKIAQTGRKCEKCPSTNNIQIHHLNYRNIYDVTLSDLQTLCETCHRLEHHLPNKNIQKPKNPSQINKPRNVNKHKKGKKKKNKVDPIQDAKDKEKALKRFLSFIIVRCAITYFSTIGGINKIILAIDFICNGKMKKNEFRIIQSFKTDLSELERLHDKFNQTMLDQNKIRTKKKK